MAVEMSVGLQRISGVLRMIHTFHEQVFQRIPPGTRARRQGTMKALVKTVKDKENEDPLNNNMALPVNFTHSTPLKNQQTTDLDDVEYATETETELTESELCDVGERNEEAECWRGDEEQPKLVITKIYDLNDKDFAEVSDCAENESVDLGVSLLEVKELGDGNDSKHWRSLEILHETAEYEFCRSLEESKLFVSTSSLLEEIEAELPSLYSLARPLSHTFHTLTSYRSQARLARVDSSLTCAEFKKQRESLETGVSSSKIDRLEMEAVVQKALAEQAEKALILAKTKKAFGVQHVESEKAVLLANLRWGALFQEAKKVRMCGEAAEKENFGQITISDIYFEVNDSKDSVPGTYICTATERERVQSTSVVSETTDGKLHFSDTLRFQDLSKDFVIYIDLFKLQFKETKRALLTAALVRKFKKMRAINLSRSLAGSYGGSGFICVSQSELRLENVVGRKEDTCVLQNYLTGNLQHSIAGSSVSVLLKTDMYIKSKKSGFLNVFKQTWHRRWYSHSAYFLDSWLYPEDQESDKTPVDSMYLPNFDSVQPVDLEVCARPHSFVIRGKESGEEILFSASSHKDMLSWIDHLSLVLEQIRLWKPNT